MFPSLGWAGPPSSFTSVTSVTAEQEEDGRVTHHGPGTVHESTGTCSMKVFDGCSHS